MNRVEQLTGDILAFLGEIKHEYFKPAEQITRARLSPSQFHSLAILYRHGSLPMSELAGLLKMSKQQLTPVVTRLSDCQMVERGWDEQDRRVVRIQITEKGLQTYRSIFLEIRNKLSDKISQLPEDSLDELEILLNRLAEILLPERIREVQPNHTDGEY